MTPERVTLSWGAERHEYIRVSALEKLRHDLRSPLTVVLAYAELLRAPAAPAECAEAATEIFNAALKISEAVS